MRIIIITTMSFELYIWGPAFGLPSIDPECLAATAYFKAALPPDQWILVSAYDPSWSPTGMEIVRTFVGNVF